MTLPGSLPQTLGTAVPVLEIVVICPVDPESQAL